jgi:hypothetical protein
MEQEIQKLFKKRWQTLFDNFNKIEDGKYPGVYLIAWTEQNLSGQEIKLEDIFYVGMSNARKGLSSRLKQFIDGVEKNDGHSAGMRFFKQYSNNIPFSQMQLDKQFYIVTSTFECDVNKKTRTPKDLRIMGEICKLEYFLLAHIKEKIGKEPELNKK